MVLGNLFARWIHGYHRAAEVSVGFRANRMKVTELQEGLEMLREEIVL